MDIDEKDLVDMVLSEKIYRIFQYIEDTIKQHGDISQFKENVLYVIHFLLERQLEPRQLTATEMVVKQREYALSKEQRKKDEEHIRLLKCELEKKEKIIYEMAEQLAGLAIFDGDIEEATILEDTEQVIDYFTKKVSE